MFQLLSRSLRNFKAVEAAGASGWDGDAEPLEAAFGVDLVAGFGALVEGGGLRRWTELTEFFRI